MRRHLINVHVVGVIVGALILLGGPGRGAAQLTDDEFKCQVTANKALFKFIANKAKCVIKCNQGARKGQNPASDCTPGEYFQVTGACVNLAEAIATVAAKKKCTGDACPECYGDSPDCGAADAVANTESNVDGFVGLVYCDDSGSGDGLTAAEGKCQDAVAKSLSKFSPSTAKCFTKCWSAARKGKVAASACEPPASDPKTTQCITTAEMKAAASIDKNCKDVDANPECYDVAIDEGVEWVRPVEAAIEATQGSDGNYCGSPSGAFLD